MTLDIKAIFTTFCNSTSAKEIIESYKLIQKPTYQEFKDAVLPTISFSQKALFAGIDASIKRSEHLRTKEPSNIVVSGAGPCGLRAAIEAAILGHRVALFELRDDCSRHNILKTGPQLVDDLLGFGIKIYIPSVSKHGHLHMGTNEIQLCLLRTCLMLGVQVHYQRAVCGILDPAFQGNPTKKWCVWTLPEPMARPFLKRPVASVPELGLSAGETNPERFSRTSKVNFYEEALTRNGAITTQQFEHDPSLLQAATLFEFDTLLVAEGESSRLIRNLGFDRQLIKFGEAIGIVINLKFSTSKGPETKIQEFVTLRMEAKWREGPLGKLEAHGIELENLEYMRGTSNHFIAATTKIKELEKYGVVKESRPTVRESLQADNMDFEKLRELGKLIAEIIGIPKEAPFAQKNGVQAFDFSCRGQCVDSYRFLTSMDGSFKNSLVLPIGDALQNPYWPQGLGVNRGFHGALNAVWSAHLFGSGCDSKIVKEEQENGFYTMNFFPPHVVTSGNEWTADPVSRWNRDLFKKRHFEYQLRPEVNIPVPKRIIDYFELN